MEFKVQIKGSSRELLERARGSSPKQPQVHASRGPRRAGNQPAPVTRPVYLDDERSRKAMKIAGQIAALRLTIKELEREYAQYSGVHSDPNVDLRQLMFPFAQQYITVRA